MRLSPFIQKATMDKKEKVLAFGLMAFIAYELYRQSSCICPPAMEGESSDVPQGATTLTSYNTMLAPAWVQQLSSAVNFGDAYGGPNQYFNSSGARCL